MNGNFQHKKYYFWLCFVLVPYETLASVPQFKGRLKVVVDEGFLSLCAVLEGPGKPPRKWDLRA